LWLSDRRAAPKHPLAVLSYATRHNYPEIMDVAAWETIGLAADEVEASLCSTYQLAWVNTVLSQPLQRDKTEFGFETVPIPPTLA